MKSNLKLFRDESFEMEMHLKNKIKLLNSPVDLLNEKEIKELKTLFAEYSHKVEKLIHAVEELNLNNTLNNSSNNLSNTNNTNNPLNKLNSSTPPPKDEYFQQYSRILTQYNDIQNSIEEKILQYEEKRISQLNRSGHIRDDSNSDLSDYAGGDRIEISRIFLNSVITTVNISILKEKQTLQEEQNYILEIFNLSESYPNSKSKQKILIDFYTNNYKFTLNQKFSLEKISTFLSIIYFIFTFSVMNKKIIKEKSMTLFREIIEYHSNNRPPFSYEIFSPEEKNHIIAFVNSTFYRNYTLFENIFKYNINIYFYSQDFKKIPGVDFPKIINHNNTSNELSLSLKREFMIDDPKSLEIVNKKYFIENEERKKRRTTMIMLEKERERNTLKSEAELQEEAALEKLKVFVNSFYKSKDDVEKEKVMQENLRIGKIVEMEVNETKTVLESKIPEIMKETSDRIDLANKEILKNVNNQLNVLNEPKNKK
jgi:hypothetical protein